MKSTHKKVVLFFILYCFLLSPLNTNGQVCQWAKNAGGISDDYGQFVTTDTLGNVYVVGGFKSSSIGFGPVTLTNNGVENIYIVKYDSVGNVIWAKHAGGTGTDQANSIAIGISGSIYVTGFFSSPTITFGTTTLINTAGNDIFLVKYDLSGNVIWAKSAGGNASDIGNSVSVSISGDIYIAGSFTSSSVMIGASTMTNMGADDMFIAKYDSSGNGQWAVSSGGTYSEIANTVITDASGKVYVAGHYNSNSIAFGSHTLTNPYPGVTSIFLVKFDTNGNVIWAENTGGNGYNDAASISTDTYANIYVVGFFEGGSISFDTTTLTGPNDAYIAKYDSSGNALWAKEIGGNGTEFANAVTVDPSGNAYVAGIFDSHFITIGTSTFTNADTNYYDLFLVKYSPSGSILWAKNGSGATNDNPNSIALDKAGDIYVTGSFNSEMLTIDAVTLTNANPVSSYDMFLARLSIAANATKTIVSTNGNTSVYPNPTSRSLSIATSDKITSIIITNLIGQTIYTHEYNAQNVQVNVADLPKGIYFIKINGSDVRKFVKE